jgi:hypothetical protein
MFRAGRAGFSGSPARRRFSRVLSLPDFGRLRGGQGVVFFTISQVHKRLSLGPSPTPTLPEIGPNSGREKLARSPRFPNPRFVYTVSGRNAEDTSENNVSTYVRRRVKSACDSVASGDSSSLHVRPHPAQSGSDLGVRLEVARCADDID